MSGASSNPAVKATARITTRKRNRGKTPVPLFDRQKPHTSTNAEESDEDEGGEEPTTAPTPPSPTTGSTSPPKPTSSYLPDHFPRRLVSRSKNKLTPSRVS